jgi:dTDP-4-amino-4,6-dideoxygalactose transaminase
MSVPFTDLAALQREIDDEVWPRLREAFSHAHFIGGPAVAEFEAAYARFTGVAHCVGVANGTDAIELALRACRIGRGDEVVVPGNTFIATVEAVLRAGATPVFVDVDRDHLLMDPRAFAAAITRRTRAVIPVHLYGRLAPVAEIAELAARHDIVVIEDAAQSQGARVDGRVSGGLATIGATSFYPGKNLGAAGDAGAVTTDDPELARAVRVISAHGSERKYEHERIGFNSRLDAVQAIVLSAKLKRLDAWNSRRRELAEEYTRRLADVDGVLAPATDAGESHVWHLYVVRVDDRDAVADRLSAQGIGTGIHYPVPVHLSPALGDLALRPGSLPVVEEAASRLLSLPIFPTMSHAHLDAVVAALAAATQAQLPREERVA